eukprot:14329094-Heterocapsa_arctica.AAC.1
MGGGAALHAKLEVLTLTRNSVHHTFTNMGKNADSDRTDQDSDDNYPGHKVRMGSYNIMVENHKDKIFQQREEAEAIRNNKNRKMDHD